MGQISLSRKLQDMGTCHKNSEAGGWVDVLLGYCLVKHHVLGDTLPMWGVQPALRLNKTFRPLVVVFAQVA